MGKEKDGIWINLTTRRKVKIINRDVAVFAFFFLLSLVFWYLNSLEKETESNVKVNLMYINPPKNRIIIEEIPSVMTLSIKGTGYSIIKYKLSRNKSPLKIDVSKVTYRKVPDNDILNYYILTAGLFRDFTFQLKTDCEVIDVMPDTLFFTMGRIETKSSVSTVQISDVSNSK